MMVYPTQERVERMMEVAHRFLEEEEPTARLWQSLLRHLSSLEKLVPGGKLRMRSLQFCPYKNWRRSQDMDIGFPPAVEALQDLEWWTDESRVRQGISIRRAECTLTLFTDASKTGWGGAL